MQFYPEKLLEFKLFIRFEKESSLKWRFYQKVEFEGLKFLKSTV